MSRENLYDEMRLRFDSYQQPYTYLNGSFVAFSSGEMGYTRARPDPDDRILYPQVNCRVFSSADIPKDIRKRLCVFPANDQTTPVPPQWLHYEGIQYMLYDIERNLIVGLENRSELNEKRIPRNKRNFSVYWPCCDDSRPIGGPLLYWPAHIASKEERQYLEAAAVAAKFVDPSQFAIKHKNIHWGDVQKAMHSKLPAEFALTLNLQEAQRLMLNNGFTWIKREKKIVNYLTVV